MGKDNSFMKIFFYLYYFLCLATIWSLSFLDDIGTFGDDAVHHFCDVVSDENTESMRAVTAPLSFLLILPFIVHSVIIVRKRRNFWQLILTAVISIFWFFLFVGRYLKCY
ncbi:DUF2645 family protein [Salmonella enterica]|nr:DUF2645 family protein [Salmonella enterica]